MYNDISVVGSARAYLIASVYCRLVTRVAQKLNYPLSIHHEHTSGATKTTLLRDKRDPTDRMETWVGGSKC